MSTGGSRSRTISRSSGGTRAGVGSGGIAGATQRDKAGLSLGTVRGSVEWSLRREAQESWRKRGGREEENKKRGRGFRDSLIQAFLGVLSHVVWLLGGEWEGNQVHLSPKGLVGGAAEAGPRAPDSVLEFGAVEHSGTF